MSVRARRPGRGSAVLVPSWCKAAQTPPHLRNAPLPAHPLAPRPRSCSSPPPSTSASSALHRRSCRTQTRCGAGGWAGGWVGGWVHHWVLHDPLEGGCTPCGMGAPRCRVLSSLRAALSWSFRVSLDHVLCRSVTRPPQVFIPKEELSLDVIKQYRVVSSTGGQAVPGDEMAGGHEGRKERASGGAGAPLPAGGLCATALPRSPRVSLPVYLLPGCPPFALLPLPGCSCAPRALTRSRCSRT